jgi:nitroreductase
MDPQMPSHHGIEDVAIDERSNETLRLLIDRASCRNFTDADVPDDLLNEILEAGRRAATGGNLQPFSIIVIRAPETRGILAEKCGQKFMESAPVHLLFCIDWRRLARWAKLCKAPFTATAAFRHFWISFQDTIIAAQNICTAIDAHGLGSVYIGTVLEFIPELRTMCDLPEGVFPVVLLCLGYPKSRPNPRRKLALGVITHRERYRDLPDEDLLLAFEDKYPDMRIPLSEERLDTFRQVCEKVTDPTTAAVMMASVLDQGYFNPVQRYFGLHYSADFMPDGNDGFLKRIRDAGFSWFDPWIPAQDRPTQP